MANEVMNKLEIKDSVINTQEIQPKINYLNLFYQNKDENKYAGFFKVDENSEIKNYSKTVNEIQEKLNEAKAQLENEYAKIYSQKYTPTSKPTAFSYYNRNNGGNYYYDINGFPIEEETAKQDCHLVKLDTKHGEVWAIDGYCYELGSIIIKVYHYNVSSDNTRCKLAIKQELIAPFLDTDQYLITRSGTTIVRNWGVDRILREYNAQEFLNNLYGVDKIISMNLADAYEAHAKNAAFELILKTAPKSLTDRLLPIQFAKSEPIYKLIGLDKPTYEIAVEAGLEVQCFELREFIKDKEKFHKSAPEWIELIKDIAKSQEDLDFFHIHYAEGWDERKHESCLLLWSLANKYANIEVLNQNYGFSKFCSYVIEETINQGFTHVSDFIRQLTDYLRMCKDQKITPTLYSSYLTQTHDIAARNHQIYLDTMQEEIFKTRYEDFKPIKVGTNENKYIVMAPENSNDIKKEGDSLNHCVASYIKRVIDGETKIFFLRKDPLKSLITLEVKNGRICQARGMHNRRPDDIETAAIAEFAKKQKLEFQCNY